MGISYTPIFLSESIVYKITDSRFQKIMWYCVEKSNVWTDVAVRTSSWSSDDNKLVEITSLVLVTRGSTLKIAGS